MTDLKSRVLLVFITKAGPIFKPKKILILGFLKKLYFDLGKSFF